MVPAGLGKAPIAGFKGIDPVQAFLFRDNTFLLKIERKFRAMVTPV
jgi:hypothetical protein